MIQKFYGRCVESKKRPVLICGAEFRAQDLDYIFQNIPHHAFRDCRTAIGPHNFATILQCYCNVEFSCNDSCRYLHPRAIHLAKSQSLCESRCASSTYVLAFRNLFSSYHPRSATYDSAKQSSARITNCWSSRIRQSQSQINYAFPLLAPATPPRRRRNWCNQTAVMVGTVAYKDEQIKFIFECKAKRLPHEEIAKLCKQKWPRGKEWKVGQIRYILTKYKDDRRYD